MKMKLYRYVLGLLLVGFCSPLSAQSDWEILSDEFSNVTFRDIYASHNTIIAVGSDLGTFTPVIARSFDGGKNWDTTQVGSGPLLRSIGFSSPNKGVITSVNTSSCILRTTDAGKTWDWTWCDQDSNFTGVNQVSFINDKIGYLAGWGSTSFFSGVVYKTTDGGENWSHVSGNLPDQPFEYLHFIDEQNGYGGSNLFGHSNLYKTTDGGKTWEQIDVSQFQFAAATFFDTGTGVMVCGNGAIRKSTDGGKTWDILHREAGVIWQGVDFLDEKNGFAVGTNLSYVSKIFSTSDSGKTWKEEAKGISMAPIEKVRFFNGRGYAVGNGGLILRSKIIDPNSSVSGLSDNPSPFRLYPNPGNGDKIHVVTQQSIDFPLVVNVSNTLGQTIHTQEFTVPMKEIVVDAKGLVNGLYHVQLQTADNHKWVERLIVK